MSAKKSTRPKTSAETIVLQATVTKHQQQWIARQAKREGLSISAFLRLAALARCSGYDPDSKPSEVLPGQRQLFSGGERAD
jgi:hypothetical protein